MAKNTFATLQAGRGLAAVGVVLNHAGTYIGTDPRFWRAFPYFRAFSGGSIGVVFFFVLSGVVMLLAHWRDQGDPKAVPVYLWKRFRRIYPIYWCVLAVITSLFILKPHLGLGYERNPLVILSSILLVNLGTNHTVLIVAWTLYHEVLFYGIFALILLHRRFGYAVMLLWMLGSVLALFGIVPADVKMGFFSPLHLLFGLGMVITWMFKKWPSLTWPAPLISGSCIVIFALLWSALRGDLSSVLLLFSGIGFMLLLIGLMELERRERLRVWGWLNVLGAASYSIYLVHFPLLSVTFRLSYALDRHVHAPLLFWLLLNACVATAFGIAVHFLLERPLLRALENSRWQSSLRLSPGVRSS